jgi:hypothetical protein
VHRRCHCLHRAHRAGHSSSHKPSRRRRALVHKICVSIQ